MTLDFVYVRRRVETGTRRPTAVAQGPADPGASERLACLRQIFDAVGYTGPAARAALGAELGPSYRRADLPLYLERLTAATPLNTLIKVFGLFLWVDEAELRAAVAPLEPDELVALGVVERSGHRVRAAVGLSARSDILLAHDRYDAEAPDPSRDHVLGVNTAAVTVESLTVRRRVRSALDLGCGGGIQALFAARHSEHVIAVDKNPRALDFTRFNAQLNGLRNVEGRQGDLFEPVAGLRFDLIVCNPPYVISPESRYTFRDSGRRGDALCEDVVRRAPAHLEEGGFATILCNWTLRAGEEWSAALRRADPAHLPRGGLPAQSRRRRPAARLGLLRRRGSTAAADAGATGNRIRRGGGGGRAPGRARIQRHGRRVRLSSPASVRRASPASRGGDGAGSTGQGRRGRAGGNRYRRRAAAHRVRLSAARRS